MSKINFSIQEIGRDNNSYFNLEQILYTINFGDIFRSFENAINDLFDMFKKLVITFSAKMKTQDKIRIIFFHESINEPIELPFVYKQDFTPELLMQAFEDVMQSYDIDVMNTDDIFTANVQIVTLPIGSGRPGLGVKKKQKVYQRALKINNNILNDIADNSIQAYCNKKTSIIKVKKNDNLCLLRAVLIAIAHLNNEPYLDDYRKPCSKLMTSHLNIIKNKIKFPNGGCGIKEIFQIETYLEDYCITLIDGSSLNKYYYKGPKKEKFIYICFTNSHYNVITNMATYLTVDRYCNYCNVGSNDTKHFCQETCKCCMTQICRGQENENLKCLNCKVIAKDAHCLQRHRDLICKHRITCKVCTHYITKKHICLGQKYCQKCREIVPDKHLCYMKPDKKKIEAKFNGLIFFDYEAIDEKSIHVPNLIIAHKVCLECINSDTMC
jgi:hypothetical protein